MINYGIDIESSSGVVASLGEIHQGEHSNIDIEISAVVSDETPDLSIDYIPDEKVQSADVMLAKKRHHMGLRAQRHIGNAVGYILLCAMTVIWLLPYVGIVMDSFRCSPKGNGITNYFFPKAGEWGIDNYVYLFTKTDFLKWFGNTFLMGVVVSILQTVFVLAMSYVLSRTRFKGRKTLMNFMLILGMFPGFLTLILLYKLLYDFGLANENAVAGLILVYVASSGMGYYVSKGYFDTIPKSLDEAARVDGATRAQVMWKIILPMAKPIVIYTILMGFMAPWGDFVMAKYIAHLSEAGYNVAVGMQMWIDKMLGSHFTIFCAGGVIVSIPVAGLFMALQKYYVAGVAGGAVKG